jgi:hypothetical protein
MFMFEYQIWTAAPFDAQRLQEILASAA